MKNVYGTIPEEKLHRILIIFDVSGPYYDAVATQLEDFGNKAVIHLRVHNAGEFDFYVSHDRLAQVHALFDGAHVDIRLTDYEAGCDTCDHGSMYECKLYIWPMSQQDAQLTAQWDDMSEEETP